MTAGLELLDRSIAKINEVMVEAEQYDPAVATQLAYLIGKQAEVLNELRKLEAQEAKAKAEVAAKRRGRRKKTKPPPEGAIDCAGWLYKVLCDELHAVRSETSLTAPERRAEVAKLARQITQATPNYEIFKAQQALREEEDRAKPQKLQGEVTRVQKGGARSLHTSAPRRPEPDKPLH